MGPKRAVLSVTLALSILSTPLVAGAADRPEHTDVLTFVEFADRLEKAKREGYQVTVQEEPCDFLKWPKRCPTKTVKMIVVKEGKSQEGKGFLGIKWDQRMTWMTFFIREGDKLKVVASEGVREEKAPVAGTWRQTQKFATLPEPFQRGVSE